MPNLSGVKASLCHSEARPPENRRIRPLAERAEESLRSFASLRMTLGMLLLLPLFLYAGPQEVIEAVSDAVMEIKESSRPIFDPDSVKEKTHPADPFVEKLREKRAEFLREQMEEKREFFAKIKRKDLEAPDRQKRLSKFRQKEVEELREFNEKQKKKLDKHFHKV